jgi:hypothetical protein
VNAEPSSEPSSAIVSPFSAADVEAILREEGWLSEFAAAETEQWMRDAAESLGLQVALHSVGQEKRSLRELLALIFSYDAAKMLELKDNQAVMAREGARDVIRELASRVLAGGEIDSERLREIIAELKAIFGSGGRKIFYPLRMALAGRTGEGELDRVILLLDRAAQLPFSILVKSARARMLEFCAALR